MLRGIRTLAFVFFALVVLVTFSGCPEPTQPVVKPQGNGTGTDDKPPPVEEKTPPDDPQVVKALQDGGHKLKLDDAGHVVEATLVQLGDVEKTTTLLEQVAKLTSLTRLKAGGPDVTNAGLENIAGLKNLKVLDLDQAKVDDDGMKHLAALPLVDINLKLTDVRDDGVGHLAKIQTLKQLKLIKTKVTNAGIAHVKNMPNLEGIDLQDVNTVDNACLSDIKGLKKLKFLRIYGPTFHGDGIAPIGEITSLRSLSMQQTDVNDQNVHHLKGLTGLERVSFYGCRNLSDQGMAELAGLTRLRELDLRATVCGTAEMEKYLAHMPELRVLDLSESNAPNVDQAIPAIARLKNLENLNLWHAQVTDNAVALLAPLTNLKSLNLDDNPRVTDASMDTVGKFTNLEFLHIGSTGVTDAGLAKLHNLKNLKRTKDDPALHITFLNVSDEAVEALMEAIPALKEEGAIKR
jgi:Leucine-rich repeat (LRR) protein